MLLCTISETSVITLSSDEEVMGCNGILAGGFLDISNRMWSLIEIPDIIAIDSRKFEDDGGVTEWLR